MIQSFTAQFKKQSLKIILNSAFALTFTLPLLTFFAVVIYFDLLEQTFVQFALIGFLVFALAGFTVLRGIVDQIMHLSTDAVKLTNERLNKTVEQEHNELKNIANTFHNLVEKLEDNTSVLGKRIEELSSLRDLTELFSKTVELNLLFEKVLENLMSTTNSYNGMIVSLSADGKFFHVEAMRGIEKNALKTEDIPVNETISGIVLSEKNIFVSANVENEDGFSPEYDNIFSGPYISKSLTARGRTIGVIILSRGNSEKHYSDAIIEYVSTALGQIAFAFDNAQLIHELKESNEALRTIQEKLIQYERAAAVSQTVVTLSDQINSPLMVIQGNIEIMKERHVFEDKSILKSFDTILESIRRCNDIMTRLKNIREPAVKDYADGHAQMIDIDHSVIDDDSEK